MDGEIVEKGQDMYSKFVTYILGIALFSLLFMPSAHAYIDPGTASMLLQILAACGVAMLVFGKRIFFSIRGFFMKSNSDDGSGNEK